MSQNSEHRRAHASDPARRLPSRPSAIARRASLVGRAVAFIPEGAPVLIQARRNFAQLDDPAAAKAAELFLVDHPLPLTEGAVVQCSAYTVAIGLFANNISVIEPPPGHHALPLVAYLPTGSHRPADTAEAAQWRECGSFDIQCAPDELLDEALGCLGLKLRGPRGEAVRRRLDACLQSDAEAASQLFASLPWLHLIKHRLQLRGLDRPSQVATVPPSLAARTYTEIYGTDIQVPYARASASAPDWRH